MNLYTVSIMAFNQLHPKAPARGSYIEHRPGLVRAHSIEEAAGIAKADAFRFWPIPEHWYAHQAAIEPFPRAEIEGGWFFPVITGDRGDRTAEEPPQVFQFDV